MSKEIAANPYSFIKRNEEQQGVFRCEHREAVGTFKVKMLTVMDLSNIEALRAQLVGGSYLAVADDLATRQAWVAMGFEKAPEGFNVGKLRSEALLHALYLEVKSHHDYFREPAVEAAVPFASGDVA
jgi:hypothetical protein